jgi:hypothetical protein
MFVRFRALVVPSLLFAAACTAGSPSTPSPGDPGDPGPAQPVTPTDQSATSFGMVIMSADKAGTPRLMRAIVPRASVAGLAPALAARDHVAAISSLWVQRQRPMALTETGTQRLRNGATVVKLAQHVDGVRVNQGEISVLLNANGELAAVSGTLLPASIKPKFVSSAREALDRVLDYKYGASRPQLAISDGAIDSAGWQILNVASTPQLKVESARVRRELAQENGKPVEAWVAEVTSDAIPDPLADAIPDVITHSYVVKDRDGKILRDTDLVQSDTFVYRVYAEANGLRRPFDGPLQSFAPHPTGVPDGSEPGLVPSNLVVMEAFNSTRDKWLADDATTTSGNNVETFADLDDNRVFSPGDVRPEVRAGRVLNYSYNHELGPTDTADDARNSKAAAVNVFFLANWMHDWWYDSGFTEATANAQRDNYGRGGVGGDPIFIEAQAGATVGLRNNANMATPSDGAQPRMRMYLWTPGARVALAGPNGPVRAESFQAGPRAFDLTAELVAGVDATAPITDGCQPITNAVSGKVVLLFYSAVCGSLATVNSAKAAGAIGIILADGTLENPRSFGGSAAANIPGLTIGKTDGERLVTALGAGPVSVALHSEISGPERDGDLDNTVIAHEWGHYLHHRLAECGAQQCGGMSEGWGDFNALLMMLREGDNRDGTYAEGPYAVANGTTDFAYFGIRRFPYSLDRTKNPLTFRHIGDDNPVPGSTTGVNNSEVHNTGEIWASMMWEALNVLVDEHGVTVARRRMSDYVVAGLLLTPAEATFTEARDAILAAASALDTDDMTLMAAAFAGRGAGSCAVSPSNASVTNLGVVESGTLAGKLAASDVTLIDDGISCDHDGYLDPGESGTLHVTVANNGILAAEQVSITATTANTGVRLGAPVRVAVLQPFSSADLAIPVTVLQTAPRNAAVTINLRIVGDNTCDRNGVSLALTIRTGADDVANAAKIDAAETRLSPWTPTGDFAGNFWGRAREANGNQSFFVKDAGFPTDTRFESPALLASTTEPFVLKIKHAYDLEASGGMLFDGGMIEVSTDAGATWSDVTTFGVNPGYTGALFVGSDNPLGGRQAFSGTSPGFPARSLLTLDFGAQFAGRSVMVRFRVGTDAAVAQTGWDIDDVEVSGITNTPFPILISEPSTCTARQAPLDDSSVIATREAPTTSLAAFDGEKCITNDTPRPGE